MMREALLMGLLAASAAPAGAFLVRPPTAARTPAFAARGGLRPQSGTSSWRVGAAQGSRGARLPRAATTSESEDKVKEAVDKCREAVARKPENEEAWFLLGVLLQETGELDDAQTAFEKSTVSYANSQKKDVHKNI